MIADQDLVHACSLRALQQSFGHDIGHLLDIRAQGARVASEMCIRDSPKIAFDLLPLISPDRGGFLKSLDVSYEGDESLFTGWSSEDNFRNILNTQVRGAGGPWTLLVDNTLVYVDGPTEDPYYSTYSPLGYREARDRRNQVEDVYKRQLQQRAGGGWRQRCVFPLGFRHGSASCCGLNPGAARRMALFDERDR